MFFAVVATESIFDEPVVGIKEEPDVDVDVEGSEMYGLLGEPWASKFNWGLWPPAAAAAAAAFATDRFRLLLTSPMAPRSNSR